MSNPKTPRPRARTKAGGKKTGEDRLPGDLSSRELLARIIRVDHAGECGAKRIYEGQLAVLGGSDKGALLQHMADQELHHLETFKKMMVERRVRPTLLMPFWHVAGYALGAGTALMGERAAMACTVAVEEVIDGHYAGQHEKLGDDEKDLKKTIERFRAEEMGHRDMGIDHDAELTPGYCVLYEAIKAGTRAAIWLSERV